MKKSRVLFAVLLAALLPFAVTFSGCGKDTSGKAPVVQSKPDSREVRAASQAPSQKPAAATAQNTAPKKVVIGFSLGDLKEERWKKDRDLFTKRASDLGAKVLVQDAGGDPQVQIEQSKNLLLQGANVLVVVPKNGAAASPIIQAAALKNVPVISYDRLILREPSSAYISFDNAMVGEIQAAQIVAKAPKGKYLLLGGDTADRNSAQIRTGQMKVLKPLVDKGDIEIVSKPFCDKWSRAEATRYTEDALAKYPDLVAIVASNDGLAGGAIAALKAKGKTPGQVAVSGQDADLEAMKNVAAGWQTVTVYKPIAKIAEAAALLATQIVQGKSLEEMRPALQKIDADAKVVGFYQGAYWVPTVYLKPIPITRDDVDIVIDDGFHTKHEVYGG